VFTDHDACPCYATAAAGPTYTVSMIQGRHPTSFNLHARPAATQARHDPLTGLPNRRLFIDRLGDPVRGRRPGTGAFGLCYLDLDSFKVVNDTKGQ